MAEKKRKLLEIIDDNYLEKLYNALGGKENITYSTHCLTRMRIVPKDPLLVNDNIIKNLEGVKGTFTASGQYQIVFGPDVEKIYKKFTDKFGLERSGKTEVKQALAKEKNLFKRFLNYMSDIFIPIVPVLVSGGIILGLRNVFEAVFDESYFTGRFDADGNPILGWSMVNVSQFMNGLNGFLWIPAQVCFWWLPVSICWSIFRKMGADEILGVLVGLTLLVGPLVNVYEVFNNKLDSIWIWDIVKELEKAGKDMSFDFGFMKYPWKIAYTSQVIPAMGIGVVGAYINLWIKRVSPNVISQISVPTVTLLSSFTLGLFIIGPIGYVVGSAIGLGFQWALTNSIAKYFFAVIIGLFHAALVITGMHHLLNAVILQNVAQNGGDFIFMSICAQAIGQGSAVIGWMILNRKDKKSREVGYSSVVAAYLGVTEPALYGVNLKHLFPFLAGSISTAIALEICVIAGVTGQSIGNGSWLGVLSVQVNSKIDGVKTFPGTGYLWFMIANLVNAAVAIVLCMFLGKLEYFKNFNSRNEQKKIDQTNAKELKTKKVEKKEEAIV